MPSDPPKVFISYRHADEAWKDRLVTECGYGRREREVAWLEGRLDEGK